MEWARESGIQRYTGKIAKTKGMLKLTVYQSSEDDLRDELIGPLLTVGDFWKLCEKFGS